jgi:hypothetical protein
MLVNLNFIWSILHICTYLVYFMAVWYILWPFGIFYDHLEYSMAIWYILWPFGIFYGHLVYFVNDICIFSRFEYVLPRKIWQSRFWLSRNALERIVWTMKANVREHLWSEKIGQNGDFSPKPLNAFLNQKLKLKSNMNFTKIAEPKFKKTFNVFSKEVKSIIFWRGYLFLDMCMFD